MTPIFFAKQSDFRKWLLKNHKRETELLVGFYKVDSEKPSMTWSQSVDEALCFGWIDGVRKSIDKDSYQIRFTQAKINEYLECDQHPKNGSINKEGTYATSRTCKF